MTQRTLAWNFIWLKLVQIRRIQVMKVDADACFFITDSNIQRKDQ